MKEKMKWTREKTKSIIKLKHSEQYSTLFEAAKNNPRQLQKTWQQLAIDFGHPDEYDNIKIKYNGLLNMYRKFMAESKRSGSGSVEWGYWDTFNLTFNGKLEIQPSNVIECGNFADLTIKESKNAKIILCDKTYQKLHCDQASEAEDSRFSSAIEDKPSKLTKDKKRAKMKSLKETKHLLYEAMLDKIHEEKAIRSDISINEELKNFKRKISKRIRSLDGKISMILDTLLNKK